MTTTFACLARSDAIETWSDSEGRIRQIRYRKGSNGHRVSWDVDGSPFPAARLFRSIEEARDCWRQRREDLRGRGFDRVTS